MTKTKTLEDWLRVYYPISATEWVARLNDPLSLFTILDLLDAAILKWSGAAPKILEEYNLIRDDHTLVCDITEQTFEFSTDTCSLCLLAYDLRSEYPCPRCPITQARGGIPCYKPLEEEYYDPYASFTRTGDNKPMIAVLEATKEFIQQRHSTASATS